MLWVTSAAAQPTPAPMATGAALPAFAGSAEAREQYAKGVAQFDRMLYGDARQTFERLFTRADGLGRRVEVAYSLAQCLRTQQDFPNAFHFYRYAHLEPSRAERAEPGPSQLADWRSEAKAYLEPMMNNLAVVTLVWEVPGFARPEVCDLKVDERGLTRYAPALPGVTLESPHSQAVATALEHGGLAGVRHGDDSPYVGRACHDGKVVLAVDRTTDHVLEYTATIVDEKREAMQYTISKARLESGQIELHLMIHAAKLSVRFSSNGKALPVSDTQRISTSLSPLDGRPEIPLLSRGQLVTPATYRLNVATDDWDVAGPILFELRPGDSRELQVDLKRTFLQRNGWIVWVGGIVAAGLAGALVYSIATTADSDAPPADWRVDLGSSGR